MAEDGEIKDYLEDIIEKNKNYGSTTLTQQRKDKRIIELVGLNYVSKNVKMHDIPTCSNNILGNDPDVKPIVQRWNHRDVVGCLRYYNAMVRPDIIMAKQHCARFCNPPSRKHK